MKVRNLSYCLIQGMGEKPILKINILIFLNLLPYQMLKMDLNSVRWIIHMGASRQRSSMIDKYLYFEIFRILISPLSGRMNDGYNDWENGWRIDSLPVNRVFRGGALDRP